MLSRASRAAPRAATRSFSHFAVQPGPQPQVTVLSNGIKVVTQKTHTGTACVGAYIEAGTKYAAANQLAAPKFIDFTALDGTATRTRDQLAGDLDAIGADLEHWTSKENTVFKTRCLASHLPKAVDILADLVQNQQVTPEKVSTRLGAYKRDQEEVEKDVEQLLVDRTCTHVWRNHELGRSLYGHNDNAEALTAEGLKEYLANNWTSDRLVVAATGDVDHAKVVADVQAKFAKLPRGTTPPVTRAYWYSGAVVWRNDEMGLTTHCSQAWEAPSVNSPFSIYFDVFASILGTYTGDNSQRIIPHVLGSNRCKVIASSGSGGYGTCDSYAAFYNPYKESGMFGWVANTEAFGVADTYSALTWHVNALSHSIQDEEVERAKRELWVARYGQDGAADVCERLGLETLNYGRPIAEAEFKARLDGVDASSARRVAYDHLHGSPMTANTAIGPAGEIMTDWNFTAYRSGLWRY